MYAQATPQSVSHIHIQSLKHTNTPNKLANLAHTPSAAGRPRTTANPYFTMCAPNLLRPSGFEVRVLPGPKFCGCACAESGWGCDMMRWRLVHVCVRVCVCVCVYVPIWCDVCFCKRVYMYVHLHIRCAFVWHCVGACACLILTTMSSARHSKVEMASLEFHMTGGGSMLWHLVFVMALSSSSSCTSKWLVWPSVKLMRRVLSCWRSTVCTWHFRSVSSNRRWRVEGCTCEGARHLFDKIRNEI